MFNKKQIIEWLEGLPDDCSIVIDKDTLRAESKFSKYITNTILELNKDNSRKDLKSYVL